MNVSKAVWRKASHSKEDGSNCIELAGLSGTVAVRDSKDPSGPVLLLTRAALRAALAPHHS
jgi:hypothetical protein